MGQYGLRQPRTASISARTTERPGPVRCLMSPTGSWTPTTEWFSRRGGLGCAFQKMAVSSGSRCRSRRGSRRWRRWPLHPSETSGWAGAKARSTATITARPGRLSAICRCAISTALITTRRWAAWFLLREIPTSSSPLPQTTNRGTGGTRAGRCGWSTLLADNWWGHRFMTESSCSQNRAAPPPPNKQSDKPIRIRPAARKDLDSLYELDQRCFRPGIAYSKTELRYFLFHLRSVSIIAEDGEAIAGFAIVEIKLQQGRHIGHIVTIDVAPEQRRRGVGRLLMNAILLACREAKAESLRLE